MNPFNAYDLLCRATSMLLLIFNQVTTHFIQSDFFEAYDLLYHQEMISFESTCTKLIHFDPLLNLPVTNIYHLHSYVTFHMQVFEAIQSGTKAMKDKMITIEEVQHCLDDLDETINSQKQVDSVLGTPKYDSLLRITKVNISPWS